MELISAIENRRSIRAFKSDNLSDEVIKDILNYGILAPSAKNRQPWYFVVLKNEIKNKIADLMIDYTKNHNLEEERDTTIPSSILPTANIIKQAPVLVLVFRSTEDYWVVSDNLSIGACVENICLRATDLGIGSLWIRDTYCVNDEVSKLLNHTDMELNCAIALGIADQNPKKRPRKELDTIIEWYR